MRKFKFADDKSYKFWNIELQGASYTVTFGRIGTKGQTKTKEFAGPAEAQKAYDKIIAEKLGEGYVEITPAVAPSSTEQVLEKAILADPDDLAAHSAYADYLTQQGNPRGEFIQVQLALEEPAQPAQEQNQFRRREKELLEQHGREWLGDLGRFLFGNWSGEDKPYQCQFFRGWLDTVRTLPFPDAILASLSRSPESRLLRRLEVVYDMRFHPFDFDQHMQGPNQGLTSNEEEQETYEPVIIMPPLLKSPYLSNLRSFKLGFSDSEPLGHSTMVEPFGNCDALQVIELLKQCPRLEELYLNTGLGAIERLFAAPELAKIRVLQYYFGSDYTGNNPSGSYPLRVLANNASLENLHTLRLHPGRDATIEPEELNALLRSPHLPSLTHLQVHMTTFGNEVYGNIVQSGILRRLKVLDLGFGTMTDEGARLLAASNDLKNLETLIVNRNALTSQGIAILQATGIQVSADDQHGPDENDFLYEVDFE